jgi:hypothetical protein
LRGTEEGQQGLEMPRTSERASRQHPHGKPA